MAGVLKKAQGGEVESQLVAFHTSSALFTSLGRHLSRTAEELSPGTGFRWGREWLTRK